MNGPDAGVTPQAGVCDRFLRCTAEVAPDQSAGAVAAYGADGACWKSADKATCERGCRLAVEGLHDKFPASAACALCASPADCTAERPACSAARGECVTCTGDEHCQGGAAHCEVGSAACVACTSDDHCADPAPACRAATHQCVECTAARHCGAGRTCVDNACCTLDRCPAGACGLLPDGCRGTLDCGGCAPGSACSKEGRCEALDATYACGDPGGPFAVCQRGTELCRKTVLRRFGDLLRVVCEPVPQQCRQGPTCGCLEAAGVVAVDSDCASETDRRGELIGRIFVVDYFG